MPFRGKRNIPIEHLRRQKLKTKLKTFSLIKKWSIVTGDKVILLNGKEKGRVGIVKRVVRKKNSVVVEGLNLSKITIPASRTRSGHYAMRESLIHRSDVALVDPVTQKATRISYEMLDGKKVRYVLTKLQFFFLHY
jgi:large subunit ribosomal protein L24